MTDSISSAPWRLRDRELALDRPRIAGVLNVTPDSFSDGGRYLDPEAAVARGLALVAEGADLIDIGGESTRPGARPVTAREEWDRLEGPLEGLLELGVPVSVDTTKLEVAERAIRAGAHAINDVSALRGDPRIADLAAETGAGLVLMHMRGTPQTMQRDTRYEDVVGEVAAHLVSARNRALDAGCQPDRIALDPGLGFGKSVDGNLEILARLDEIASLGSTLWIGPSRKSFLGRLLDLPPEDRVEGTVAVCVSALARGARVFRVHDVRPVRRALEVAWSIERRTAGHGASDPGRGG